MIYSHVSSVIYCLLSMKVYFAFVGIPREISRVWSKLDSQQYLHYLPTHCIILRDTPPQETTTIMKYLTLSHVDEVLISQGRPTTQTNALA